MGNDIYEYEEMKKVFDEKQKQESLKKTYEFLNAQKQKKVVTETNVTEKTNERKALAKKVAALVLAGSVALGGIGIASTVHTPNPEQPSKEQITVEQIQNDNNQLAAIEENYGLSFEEVYNEFLNYVTSINQEAGVQIIKPTEDKFRAFVRNFDNYYNQNQKNETNGRGAI